MVCTITPGRRVSGSFDAFGNPLDQGPRIPAIVISPYGVVHSGVA